MTLEDKIKLIDTICERHPAYGVEKGYSWYQGGMRDTGAWYFRQMLDVDYSELNAFLEDIIKQENAPKVVLTEQEEIDSKVIIDLEMDGKKIGWINKLAHDRIKNFHKQREDKLANFIFGK
jgi:uncharacterized protein YuzE